MSLRQNPSRTTGRRFERGATLTGYALTMATMVVVALGTLTLLEDNSETFLVETGEDIGRPRESAEDIALTQQQTYSGGNSTGSGATTTTTPPPTTAPTTTSTVPAVLNAPVNFSYLSGPSYTTNPSGAASSGLGQTATLTASTAGTYTIHLQITSSGDGTADSVWLDFGTGLQRYNTIQNVGSPQWQTSGVGSPGVGTVQVTLAAGESINITMYPREPGVAVSNIRMV